MQLESQTIDEALRLNQMDLPNKPQIVRLEWEPYEDTLGDDEMRIWVVLSDDLDEDEITGKAVDAIKTEIRDRLRQNGVGLFPYFRFVKETNLDDIRRR